VTIQSVNFSSSDPSPQMDVLRHDDHLLSMDGTEVGVLEEPQQVGLTGLLQGRDSKALEPEISLEILGNLPDQTLERQLANEQSGSLSGKLLTGSFPAS
jgi:hypothetical protein